MYSAPRAVAVHAQIGTTKGTGGDVLILEEAAYCDEGFFYETVAPILSVGNASLVAISTLTSEINFYTRLIKMVDPATDRPLFTTRCIELCCEKCKEDGKAHECVHMLHLVPSWQSQERHRKLKIMMQDRPDLIQSELAGLAFDSLQQVFRKSDVEIMFAAPAVELANNTTIWLVVDPAAGGPQSDYAVVSIGRSKGCVVVSFRDVCMDMTLRLCQYVALVRGLHKVARVLPLVDAEGHDDVVAHVCHEPHELARVAGVDPHDAVLEPDVHVEEEQEDSEASVQRPCVHDALQHKQVVCGVSRALVKLLLQLFQRGGDELGHERDLQALEKLLHDVAHDHVCLLSRDKPRRGHCADLMLGCVYTDMRRRVCFRAGFGH